MRRSPVKGTTVILQNKAEQNINVRHIRKNDYKYCCLPLVEAAFII